MPFHNRTQRWACLVAHRRAGKTVAAINDLIRAALMCKSKYPLFAYIAPFRIQAKSVAWAYLKTFAQPITAASNEQELTVTLVNGATIRLFGADNADAIRGLGFDGVVADEFGDWKPSVFPLVVRPALSDKQGWFVAMGTPKGRNSFYDVYARAQKSPEWFCMSLPADKSGLLPPTELDAARAQLTEDQFAQEYLCSFDAAIVGAYYGVDLRRADAEGRITKVPYDVDFPVYTAWDLGYTDDTAIWFYQVVKGEVHILDFHASSGSTIEELAKVVLSKPYKYGKHNLPHDARAKTLASGGKSVIEQMAHYLGVSNLAIVPNLSVQDGIQAVRMMLHRCWFDADKTADGLEALRQYQREYDEDKKAFRDRPIHNWCFVGETQILTRYGTHQIMNLPFSGEVLTSCGWKRYINPRVTRKNASLVEVRFKGGYSVKCTPDHLFKTANGWISAESLMSNMLIQSALIPSRNILTVGYTVCGAPINTILGAAKRCIVTFGEMLSGLFQTIATSTIKTPIQQTINWKTLSVCQPKYIYQKLGINIRAKGLLKKQGMPQKSGINLTLAGFGISVTRKGNKPGLNGSENQKNALFATLNLMRLCEQREPVKFIVRQLAKLKHIVCEAMIGRQLLVIESVKKIEELADVWCLTVPEIEEFALANGAIVHNCSHPADAFRMLAIAWREEPQVPRPAITKPLMVGPENEVTLNEMWAAHESQPRRSRI